MPATTASVHEYAARSVRLSLMRSFIVLAL
jgi:hypothetical protein